MAKAFIDSNVILYAEGEESAKKQVARMLLKEQKETGVISTQVMQETYVNLIRKAGATPQDAAFLTEQLRRFEVVTVTSGLISEAMKLHAAGNVSFWDALIISAAAFAGCSTLFTEDLGHSTRLSGVRIVNPFA